MCQVSVVLTAHNYGKFLDQCMRSVLSQTFKDFELIVVDDGSTDCTPDVLKAYAGNPLVRVIREKGIGLAAASNAGIRVSEGSYIIRLDADDYYDENILLIESNYLNTHPQVHMVFPDYYRMDTHGGILEHVRLAKVRAEVTLLDRSPLAAGAMFRRECYDALGGYDESLKYQEDYDFWIRFIDRFNVANVNLPLLYYRQHDRNMSRNFEGRMAARRHVKKKFLDDKSNQKTQSVLAVVPAMVRMRDEQKLPLFPINGQPLMSYTLDSAKKSQLVDRIIVSTEDPEVAELARQLDVEVPFLRPRELARSSVSVEDVLKQLLDRLDREEGYKPDLVAVLQILSPFRKSQHIDEAVDTVAIYDADAVISVCQDKSFHWRRGREGLELVGYQSRLLKDDRETLYKENGALYVTKSDAIRSGGFLGKRISYIEMSSKESLRLESDFDFWVAEQMLVSKHETQPIGVTS